MSGYSRSKLWGWFFIIPQLVIILLLFLWPAFSTIKQSFFLSDVFGIEDKFAGLKNFLDLIFEEGYLHAIFVTTVLAVSVTFLTLIIGLFLAVLVNTRVKSQTFYKSLFLWPYAVAPAIAAVLWRFLCQPSIGWVAQGLGKIGLSFNYLTHPMQALTVVVLAACWQQFSYNFLFCLVALKAIPKQLLEAATLDGASDWKQFWQIILPMLSPTLFFLITMNLIYSFFDTFGIIDVLTSGGPESSTTTLIYKAYKDGFWGMDPGSSAAQSVLLMLLVTGLTLMQFRYIEKKVHYQ
ncbi:MAG: ABC transporter permease subunit [Legionella sp.]|nr:ABC transporter permease subunit [Legionella sp.]